MWIAERHMQRRTRWQVQRQIPRKKYKGKNKCKDKNKCKGKEQKDTQTQPACWHGNSRSHRTCVWSSGGPPPLIIVMMMMMMMMMMVVMMWWWWGWWWSLLCGCFEQSWSWRWSGSLDRDNSECRCVSRQCEFSDFPRWHTGKCRGHTGANYLCRGCSCDALDYSDMKSWSHIGHN